MAQPTALKNPLQSPVNASRGAGKRLFDTRPSNGLAAGLKRIGGRGGVTRLGRSPITARHGAAKILHKY